MKFKYTGGYLTPFFLFILWAIASAFTFGILAPVGITHIVIHFIEHTEGIKN